MPYRRLPNTDAARIRALETALNNEDFSDINNLPFSLTLRQKIEFFLPKFKTAITNSQCARDKQTVNSRKYAEYTRRAKIIAGEQERTRNGGGNPIYSPSIALVKVNYENFKQANSSQKQFQQNSARYSAEVAQYRGEADEYILTLWNEIEAHYADIDDEDERRQKCENFGLVYVFRKGEKEEIKRKKEAERITLKLPF